MAVVWAGGAGLHSGGHDQGETRVVWQNQNQEEVDVAEMCDPSGDVVTVFWDL